MIDAQDFIGVASATLAVSAGLLGVAVTLLSLVPALLGALDQSGGAFVQNEVSKRRVRSGLKLMRATIVLFALGSVAGLASLFARSEVAVLCSGGTVAVGLVLLTIAAFQLARISWLASG